MPTHVYTVEIDGQQYDLEGDHEPSEAEARAAVWNTAPPAPPKKATPPPASATIGMIAPSTKTSPPATGTLMDFLPPREQQEADMRRYVDALPMAVPVTAAISAVRSIPGVIARRGAEREMATILAGKSGAGTAAKVATAAKPVLSEALKRILQGAGLGLAGKAVGDFFDQ